jgi:hypothetical protein
MGTDLFFGKGNDLFLWNGEISSSTVDGKNKSVPI